MTSEMSAHPTYHLPRKLEEKIQRVVRQWQDENRVARLWQKDASLWTQKGEENWLGWLDAVEQQKQNLSQFVEFQAWVKQRKFKHVLLMGMGGSSLAPDVFSHTFGVVAGGPKVHVLDSTDPAQVRTVENAINFASTLFIVASKSGSTLEPNIFRDYFYARASEVLGSKSLAAAQFVAITDPGSQLEKVAREESYQFVFSGEPSIGGRYSALSVFGLVPLAAQGIDIAKFLSRTHEMVTACSARASVASNPGVWLGLALGVASLEKRNKLTLVMSPAVSSLGAWLEQLVAESLGKHGKDIIPVEGESFADTSLYGDDRIFVSVAVRSELNAIHEDHVRELERAGLPVIRLEMQDLYDLGREMFRWEVATAVAGSVMGLNPFDQPDVEASKIETRKLTDEFEKTGKLPVEVPRLAEEGLELYVDDRNWAAIEAATIKDVLARHLKRIESGDYFALLAYLEMNKAHGEVLQDMREHILTTRKVATCVQFGPRFLHSTGQAYKGGSSTGVFVQITGRDVEDVVVPGRSATFGVVKAAQARGDLQVMMDRERRVVRVHLTTDKALAHLSDLMASI